MRKAILALAVSLAWVSCAPPPFDLSLSQAQFTAGRMTPLAGIGPIDTRMTPVDPGSLAFLPDRTDTALGVRFDRGFIIAQDSYRISMYFALDKGAGAWEAYRGWGDDFLGSDGFVPKFQIQTVKDPSPDNIAVITYDDGNPTKARIGFGLGDEPGRQIIFTGGTDLQPQIVSDFPFPPSSVAIGSNIYPTTSTLGEKSHFLVREGPGSYREVAWDLSTALSAPTLIRATAVALPFLDTRNHSLYFHSPATGYSYAGFYDQTTSAWSYWRWNSALAPVSLSGITGRIDAVLTTGELFSNAGGFGRVYDPDGKLLASFPTGSLTFLFEAYLYGTPYMLFSQSFRAGDQLYFGVYGVPTGNLNSLTW
jgi:hypothetical protein